MNNYEFILDAPQEKNCIFFSDWWYQNEVPWFFWWRSPLLHCFHSGTHSVTDRWYCLKFTALIFILNCLLSHSAPLPRQHWNPSTVWHALDVFECVLAPIKTLRLNFISVSITSWVRQCALTWKSGDIFIMANDSVSSQSVITGLILKYFTLLEINVYSEQWCKVYDIFKILPICDSNHWSMTIVFSCFAKHIWLFKSNRFWEIKVLTVGVRIHPC